MHESTLAANCPSLRVAHSSLVEVSDPGERPPSAAAVLSRAGWEASWTPVRLNDGGTYPYGFGWYLTQQRGYRRIGHSGAWQGFRANIQRYPDYDTTVIVLANLAEASAEAIGFGIAGLLEPALTPPHVFAARLPGAASPKGIDQLLRDIASSRDSSQVTSGPRTSMPLARREQIGGWLKIVKAWTFLGCDDVRKRRISRFGTRIERICYAKGAGLKASLLVTVLYAADWRAAGIDFYGVL